MLPGCGCGSSRRCCWRNGRNNPGDGGGIASETGAILNVDNSWISGNTAGGSGGGIDNGGVLTLKGSPVLFNTAQGGPNSGGGIDNHGTGSLQDSLVAANAPDQRDGVTCWLRNQPFGEEGCRVLSGHAADPALSECSHGDP